jgi:hypothetical protein
MKRAWIFGLAIALALVATQSARAADVCGNGVDDDADGETDEGCYPGLTTVCESPLSCEETGFVSPSTGSLRYSLPADIAPRVPWGPSIGLRRFYTSQSSPPATAQKKPMGDRWNHTYMTWVDTISSTVRVLHTSRGQDVLLTKTSSDATWDYYTPQAGHHYAQIRRRISAPNEFQVRMLTGERAVYDSSGLLTEIWDSAVLDPNPAPPKVLLTYAAGNVVSTVTDAAGKRRLKFNYTSNLLTSLEYQLLVSSVWTTQHTTTYAYTSGVLTSVTIGGQLAQSHVYSGGYLTQIQDGGGKQIVAFAYSSTVPGRVHRADSQRGMIGFDYSSSRTTCSGKTALYFNRGNTASCATDTDCGAGFLCGGTTGPGATGVCFRAARCLTIQNAAEDLVTTVTSFGPPSQSCDGACLDAAEYIWDTTGTKLDLVATKSPSDANVPVSYEARAFDANGLPTIISYGDPDTVPTTKGERLLYLFYRNPEFPGRVTELRRQSDLNTTSCGATGTVPVAGCAQTFFTYSSAALTGTGKLLQRDEHGTTLTSSLVNTNYTYSTTYSYDAQRRLTQIDHAKAGSNDLEVFEYWSTPADPLLDGHLRYYKRKLGTGWLPIEAKTYDFQGNATTLVDIDGTLSCQTFNAARGYLAEQREAMGGQTTCTANALDLVTTYVRDSRLRLTQVTRPDGLCVFYEYDTKGRLAVTKRRDDCNASSTGERQEFTYDPEGLLIKTELFDAAGTVTRRQEWTFADSRRLERIINPVNTTKWTGLTYDVRGLLTEVTSPDSLGQTKYGVSPDRRITSVDRNPTTAFDKWNLLYAWLGGPAVATEDPSGTPKVSATQRDDLGRVAKLVSPDINYAIARVHDAMGNLTSSSLQYFLPRTDSFTFDDTDRPLNDNFQGGCNTNPEIQRVYETPPVACPVAGICTRTQGRLAYVKVSLLCDGSADSSLDQETFYGYDDAGRLIREYICDDSGRVADHAYTYTKAGALSKVTLPSTSSIWFNFDSATSNSDKDRITSVARNTATNTLVKNATYYPFGPLRQYEHWNTIGGVGLRTKITRNLAYRVSDVRVENQTGATTYQSVTITEDSKGRVTVRDHDPAANTLGVQDSFITYDGLDRVLCEDTVAGGNCAGTTHKNRHSMSPPFTATGDWKRLMRRLPGGGSLVRTDFNPDAGGVPGAYGASHRIVKVRQPTYGDTNYAFDEYGRRATETNTANPGNGDRTFTYNSRGLLANVHGAFYSGGAWHGYDLASAYDARGRRVYKSYLDNTTGNLALWFFYYDAADRLTEIRHTPVDTNPSNYSVYQFVWLQDRVVGYYLTAYPGATLTRRYVGTDDTGRPIDLWSYPGSGDATRVWAINPNAFGGESPIVGATVFQPWTSRLQFADRETVVLAAGGAAIHRMRCVNPTLRVTAQLA